MLRCQVPNRVTAGHRSRTATVAVRALSLQEAGTQIAQAFVRVLSPPDDRVKAWPQNSFNGNIRRSHKPFRDGFSRTYTPPIEKTLESIDEGPATYVEDAVKGVVAGLPSSTLSEPVWTGAISGWRGELHAADKRNPRDGFHAKKY